MPATRPGADRRPNLSLNQIVLTVTERCNQRCSYCYVPVERGRTMDLHVAERALDLFFENASDTGKLSVAFFGGEPFLVPDLMRRVVEAARRRAGSRQVEFSATTNATAVDEEGLALVRDADLKLAVSHDGARGQSERRLASGGPTLDVLRRNLDRLLELDGAVNLARMTVTPHNVHGFADDVRSVYADGLRSILYLPAYEAAWDDLAVTRWAEEHRRLATWIVGLEGAGKPGPHFPAFNGVLSRLRGAPRKHCGVGIRRVAVSVEGRIHPCYRTLYDPGEGEWALGDVWTGLTHPDRLDSCAALKPDEIRPEAGPCNACPAKDGCTFFCPALGRLILGDPRAVPRSACMLARAQVEACRRLLGMGVAEQSRRPARIGWAAALAAAFIGSWLPSCGRPVGTSSDAGISDGSMPDGVIGPGVCPVLVDAGPDSSIGPGLCPFPLDGGADGTAADAGPGGDAQIETDICLSYGGLC